MNITDVKLMQDAVDTLLGISKKLLSETSVTTSRKSLCTNCRKNNICNPHINYLIHAISCGKYIKRKDS